MSEGDRIQKLENLVSNILYELACTNNVLIETIRRANALQPGFMNTAELRTIEKQRDRVKSLLKQQRRKG